MNSRLPGPCKRGRCREPLFFLQTQCRIPLALGIGHRHPFLQAFPLFAGGFPGHFLAYLAAQAKKSVCKSRFHRLLLETYGGMQYPGRHGQLLPATLPPQTERVGLLCLCNGGVCLPFPLRKALRFLCPDPCKRPGCLRLQLPPCL